MASIQEAIKIGELNFQDYKTEFYAMPMVKDYFEQKPVSLSFLLPDGWLWYESTLFESLENAREEDPDIDLGKEFKVIYTGIVENGSSEEESEEANFNEMPEDADEIILGSSRQILQNHEFHTKYIVLKK